MRINGLAKAGILILVIGIAFLAGTLYRSTKEGGGVSFSSFNMLPASWSQSGNSSGGSSVFSGIYFQAPRDFRMNIKSNGTIDVYMLDSEGIRLWREGKLAPAASFEGV